MLNVVSTKPEEIDTHESFQSSLYNCQLSAQRGRVRKALVSVCRALTGLYFDFP